MPFLGHHGGIYHRGDRLFDAFIGIFISLLDDVTFSIPVGPPLAT